MKHNLVSKLKEVLEALREDKPNDRSELDRHYAVAITDLSKVLAYVKYYIAEKL